MFNVQHTMLKDRISGRVIHGSDMGPENYLTTEEKKKLQNFLLSCAKMGDAKSRQGMLKIVHSTVLENRKQIQYSEFYL